jgi:hypothetical protein
MNSQGKKGGSEGTPLPATKPPANGKGKFILGAAAPAYALDSTGGHNSWPTTVSDLGLQVNAPTGSAPAGASVAYVAQGAGAAALPADNNMPPYVALTLCRK